MQTMAFNITFPTFEINSVVAESRVFLHSSDSRTVYIVDPISNTIESLTLLMAPFGAAAEAVRVFFAVMLQNRLRIDILNLGNMTWSDPVYFAWNINHIIGIVSFPTSLQTWFYVPPRVAMAARGKQVFVARENRVDVIDLETTSVRAILIPQSDPISVQAIGSKIVFYSSRNVEHVVSVYETTADTGFSFTFEGAGDTFMTTENFILASMFGNVKVMELSTVMNTLSDVQRFIGEDVDLTVEVKGKVLETYWQRGSKRLANKSEFSLSLHRVTQAASGTYSINS